MGRDTERRTRPEVDDGGTFETKHGSRGALILPAGLSMWKPKKSGTHVIDIVPFVTTANRDRWTEKMRFSSKQGVYFPHRIYRVHYQIGVSNDTVACVARNFGKPCPICQAANKLRESASAENEKKANDLNPKERSLFLIYDHDETDKGVQLWEVAWFNFGRHIADHIDGAPREEKPLLKVYYHPTKGYTIRINCKETPAGKGKPYTDYQVHSMTPRSTPVPDELFDHGYDLDAMVQEQTYDRIKAIYTGEEEEEPEDNDGVSNPLPSRNGEDHDEVTPPPRRSSVPLRGPGPQPAPAAKWIPTVGDPVSFEFKGVTTEGEIKSVDLDAKMVKVQIDGRDSLIKMEFSDLTLLDEGWADKKPKPEPVAEEKPGWTEKNGEDDGKTFARGKKPKPAADDDPGDEPAPPKRGKRG